MSDSLRKQIEALQRYGLVTNKYGWDDMLPTADGGWVSREAVLALLPAEPAPPAVCPSCGRKVGMIKEQNTTTFCVDPWHE